MILSHTFAALDVDHEGLLVRRLSAAHHLVDGVAGVVHSLGHVDPQHGPRVEPERLVLLSFDNLKKFEEIFYKLPIVVPIFGSETRLGYFWKVLVKNFLEKVNQIIDNIFGYSEKYYFLKTALFASFREHLIFIGQVFIQHLVALIWGYAIAWLNN